MDAGIFVSQLHYFRLFTALAALRSTILRSSRSNSDWLRLSNRRILVNLLPEAMVMRVIVLSDAVAYLFWPRSVPYEKMTDYSIIWRSRLCTTK